MENGNLIPADEFCTRYNVELSFINELNDHGLIEITSIEERYFIPSDRLNDLEKFIRLHYDLDINMPGIEAIAHMLQRIQNMQQEMMTLKNRLRLYERI